MEKEKSLNETITGLGGFIVPNAEYMTFDLNNKSNEDIKEELLNIIQKSSILYNKKVSEYLYSLYYLEMSALNKNENPKDIQEALFNYDFYKKLVSYNILNRSYKLIKGLNNDNNIFEKEYKSILIYLKNKIKNDKLVFSLSTDFNTTILDFYDNEILLPDKIKEIDNKRIKEINTKLNSLKDKILKEEENKKIELARIEEFEKQQKIKKKYALSEVDEDACDIIYGPSEEELFIPSKLSPKLEEERLKKELEDLTKLDNSYYNELYNFSKGFNELSNEIKTILFKDFGISTKDFSIESNILVKKFKTTIINYNK